MYNKLFTKILDSSIWMESATTRLVWLTFIASMDEEGFVQFASAANVAHRARVTIEESEAALKVLESPDVNSADPSNEGRRVEKVPGGWMILNSKKYRDLVTRAVIQEQTRLRVQKHRESKNGSIEPCNAECNAPVTPSEADTDTKTKEESFKSKKHFVPPSIEMCRREAKQVGMPESEGDEFHKYYSSIGWVRGKNQIPIKDWTPVMCSWRDLWKKKSTAGPGESNAGPSINSIAQADSVIQEASKQIQRIHDSGKSFAWDGGLKLGLLPDFQDQVQRLKEKILITRNLKTGLT